ncbi:MAG: acetamidase/formamidase family protein [Acidaminococcales bacterium]|jgi:amidase|nr:acetamidase/formamidase family protein [Acidaminococcales bacterium]
MRIIVKEHVIYSFNPDNPIRYEVADGETFWVEMDDCYGGQIKDKETLRPNIDLSVVDAAVGPIGISGAKAGDALCVEILDIKLAAQGVMVTSPGLGVLGRMITVPDTKIIPISNCMAHFSDNIKLPLTPMLGVIGVSPDSGDVHCAIPGNHGANMDTKAITIGSKVYLPVAVDGAGLAVGDLHACMGDGEASGTGIEIAGKVCLKTVVIKNHPLKRPAVETADSIYTIASASRLEDAIPVAVDDMCKLIMQKKQLAFQDAYRIVSAVCDIQISQVVNAARTVRVRAPKAILGIVSFL